MILLMRKIKIVILFNLGVFEICLAIFGALVVIILTIVFIKISKNEVNKLMSSEVELSTARVDDMKV